MLTTIFQINYLFLLKTFKLSGREMFYFNPDLAANDLTEDGDEAIDTYAREEEEEEDQVQYKNIELDCLQSEATEADSSGTIASEIRFKETLPSTNGTLESPGSTKNGF